VKETGIGKGKGGAKRAAGKKKEEEGEPSLTVPPLAQLGQEHAMLEAIMAATDVMLVYLDRDFNFVRVNAAYAATCGVGPEELVGKNHFTLYPHPENEAIFRQVRDTGEPVFYKDKPFEFPDQPKRGVTYWDWSLAPVKEEGVVRGLVFSLRETTKYKRAELALIESEARLQQEQSRLTAIMDATDVMLAFLDPDFNFVRVNPAYAAIFRLRPDELVGKNRFELLPDPEAEAIFRQVGTTDEPYFYKDKPTIFADQPEQGVTYWDWSLVPVRDAGGQLLGFVSSARETTQYKRAEMELAESEERFRSLAENSADLIFRIDLKSCITYASPALQQFGYQPEQVINEPFSKFIPPEALPRAMAEMQRLKAGEEVRLFELKLYRGDGTLADTQINATPLLRDGKVVGLQGMARDISELKRAEVELRRLNRVLKALGDSRQATILARGENEYLDQVCRIIVEDCGFRMVWVGYAEEDQARTVRPVAQAGLGRDYLKSVRMTWDDSDLGRGPTGTAIRTGRMAECRNMPADPAFAPWRAQARKHGYASSLALPLSAEGKAFGALTIYSPVPDGFSEGEIAMLVELAEDLAYGIITLREKVAREEAEAALRRNEAQLQTILNNITEGLVVADLDGNLIYWNPAAVTMHGYADASEGQRRLGELGDTFELTENGGEVVEVEDWPLARILRGESLRGYELRVRRLDCDWQRVFSYSGALARDDQGHPVLGIVVVSDVTERKIFEEALLRAKQEWERTFDAVPDLIAILDKRHRIIRANRAMAERLGMSPEECVGESCFSCVHGTCDPPGLCPHALTMRDGKQHEAELYEERMGGDFMVTTTPLFDDGGRMIGSVHVSRDITERKKAEARIRHLNEELKESVAQLEGVNQELERSNNDLQQFAYIASHDLQGPLHTVASFMQLLERRYRGRLDDKAESYINYAIEGTTYMQRLLTDLLAFSRVGGGKLNLRPVMLGEVVGRVVFNLQKAIADQRAEVVIDPALPLVAADESQMLHLLQNLIANAIKFHGEEVPRVEVFAENHQGEWHVCVRDNGIGIDPRYAERIFLIFQRLHKREDYGGTGIGLAICKKIVERHGGRIWVDSQPGQGATFCFSLPERREENVA
jgi:PAS domain S-box-containing protein